MKLFYLILITHDSHSFIIIHSSHPMSTPFHPISKLNY